MCFALFFFFVADVLREETFRIKVSLATRTFGETTTTTKPILSFDFILLSTLAVFLLGTDYPSFFRQSYYRRKKLHRWIRTGVLSVFN